MMEEAVSAGFYEPAAYYGQGKYPKVQILTVKELLDGKTVSLPPAVMDTYKEAPKRAKNTAGKIELIKG